MSDEKPTRRDILRPLHLLGIALACAVPMIVLTSPRAKTRSTAMASGEYRSTHSSSSVCRARRRCGIVSSRGVRITPTAIMRSGTPTPPSTTPRPHRVRPGSTPKTRTATSRLPRPTDNCSIDTLRGARRRTLTAAPTPR